MRKYFSCLPAFSLAKEPSGVALSKLSPALDKYDDFVGILFCWNQMLFSMYIT